MIPFYTSLLRWHNERYESITFPCCTCMPSIRRYSTASFLLQCSWVFMTLGCFRTFWCFSCTPVLFIAFPYHGHIGGYNVQAVDVLSIRQAAVTAGVKASGVAIRVEILWPYKWNRNLPWTSRTLWKWNFGAMRVVQILQNARHSCLLWQGLWIWHCEDWRWKSS